MQYLIAMAIVLALISPSLGWAQSIEPEAPMQDVRFETRVGGFRGQPRRGFGFRKRGSEFHKGRGFHKRRHFRRGDLTPFLYYRYPRFFYRNFGGVRKFYPRPDLGSDYPSQGGSDYRDRYYDDWFDLRRR